MQKHVPQILLKPKNGRRINSSYGFWQYDQANFYVRNPSKYLQRKCGTKEFRCFEKEFCDFEKEFQEFEKEFHQFSSFFEFCSFSQYQNLLKLRYNCLFEGLQTVGNKVQKIRFHTVLCLISKRPIFGLAQKCRKIELQDKKTSFRGKNSSFWIFD